MKILTVSTLFPYANNPKHGIFIETRLRHLMQHYPNVEAKVIAPIPYFPFTHKMFGSYSEYAKAPSFEVRHGIEVYHPQYLVVPKVGMTLAPITLAKAIYKQAKKLIASGYDFDLIDGHYFYPDGVAIEMVAKKLGKPFTVTARGTDINLIPQFNKPKKQIQHVLQTSNHNMAVCEALRQEMIAMGASPSQVSTLRNGVDLELFPFSDTNRQTELRKQLGLPLDRTLVISAGHLIERKGHHLVIEAVSKLPNTTLIIVGDGPERKSLESLSSELNVTNNVRFIGSVSQSELAMYYGASDLLVLASSREGWANVLLESMACGTPVVATDIWGTPEVIQNSDVGCLVQRTAESIHQGILQLLEKHAHREEIRSYAENFKWNATSEAQYKIFNQILTTKGCTVMNQIDSLS